MSSFSFVLEGQPLSVNNLYRSNGTRRFITDKGRALKESYAWQIRSQYRGEPIKGSVDLDVTLYYGDKRKRDADNSMKVVFDCLTGIAVEDDSQVIDHHVHKRYDKERPRVEITLTELD